MADPLLLVDNFYSVRQYPGNIITGDEEPAGFEAFRVADGRRSAFDCWTAITPNATHALIIQGDTSRRPDTMVIDRGHNLAGVSGLKYQTSTNGSIWTDVWTVTIPAIGAGGTDCTAANGCTTEEGAWVKNFSAGLGASTVWHRLFIPAMGTGILPVVVGLWLGNMWDPGPLYMPWSEDQDDLLTDEVSSPYGWKGRGPVTARRAGTLNVRFLQLGDYASTARPHLRKFRRGSPMWVCYDQAQADRTLLALSPAGSHLSPAFETGWFPRQVPIAYEEHEPLRT